MTLWYTRNNDDASNWKSSGKRGRERGGDLKIGWNADYHSAYKPSTNLFFLIAHLIFPRKCGFECMTSNIEYFIIFNFENERSPDITEIHDIYLFRTI